LMSALSFALVAIAYVSRVVWSLARQRRNCATTN
jgi:hypothetical protein